MTFATKVSFPKDFLFMTHTYLQNEVYWTEESLLAIAAKWYKNIWGSRTSDKSSFLIAIKFKSHDAGQN